ncbi:hypothetical protein ONZ45_g8368 [Pleurotus djamor]|nr:hypothetical protein ONZ45_g8368 [Pleurotus djamor]
MMSGSHGRLNKRDQDRLKRKTRGYEVTSSQPPPPSESSERSKRQKMSDSSSIPAADTTPPAIQNQPTPPHIIATESDRDANKTGGHGDEDITTPGRIVSDDVDEVRGMEKKYGARSQLHPFVEKLDDIIAYLLGKEFDPCLGTNPVDRFGLLLHSGIFPATSTQPTTGFTFQLLELFHTESLTSKKSAYDFAKSLRLRTNAATLDALDVSDIYKSFLRVMRVFRYAQMFKRSGQAHGIDEHFPKRMPGSLVLPCMPCAEPGFNMEERLNPVVDADVMHIETKFISADGHFGLPRKKKVDDPFDVGLTDGAAFFPSDEKYLAYMKRTGNSEERGAMCDLDRGEKFAMTDYCLYAGALTAVPLPQRVLLTYDINCQYHVNLMKRLQTNFPGNEHAKFRDIASRLEFRIPKMHLHGHVEDCFYLYSLDYAEGSGRTDGERIEGGWAEEKQAGGSTKEMNAGHRHDVLNDMQNFSNWMKTINLAKSLTLALGKARKEATIKREAFLDMSKICGERRVSAWSTLSTEPKRGAKYVESVYRFQQEKCIYLRKSPLAYCVLTVLLVLSEKAIYKTLMAESKLAITGTSVTQTPACLYLHSALQAEATQIRIRLKASRRGQTTQAIQQVVVARESLTSQLKKLESLLMKLNIPIPDSPLTSASSENYLLFLPSNLDDAQRTKYGIGDWVDIERRLREGQANDAIRLLRLDILTGQSLTSFSKSKSNAVHGVQKTTRSQKWIRKQKRNLQIHTAAYNTARKALLRLGMPPDDDRFPALSQDDLVARNPTSRPVLGESRQGTSWIWRVARMSDLSSEERGAFDEDAMKVRWFRAKADMWRWQEELEILEAEFQRTIRGFERMAEVWELLSESEKQKKAGPGAVAYAKKKVATYQTLASKAHEQYKDVGGAWPDPDVPLADFVRARRPRMTVDWSGVVEPPSVTEIGSETSIATLPPAFAECDSDDAWAESDWEDDEDDA